MTQEKQDPSRDRFLGMDQPITRRDFLNGIAVGAATAVAAASGPLLGAVPSAAELPPAAQDAFGYYPPTPMHCATANQRPRPRTPARNTT
jgi:hypothetical protein